MNNLKQRKESILNTTLNKYLSLDVPSLSLPLSSLTRVPFTSATNVLDEYGCIKNTSTGLIQNPFGHAALVQLIFRFTTTTYPMDFEYVLIYNNVEEWPFYTGYAQPDSTPFDGSIMLIMQPGDNFTFNVNNRTAGNKTITNLRLRLKFLCLL